MVVAVHTESSSEPELVRELRWPLRFAQAGGEDVLLFVPLAGGEVPRVTEVDARDPAGVGADAAEAAAAVRAALDALLGADGWEPVSGEEPGEPAKTAKTAKNGEPAGPQVVRVRLRLLQGPARLETVTAELVAAQPALFCLVQHKLADLDGEGARLRRGLMKKTAAQILLVRPGTKDETEGRILVPLARGPHCKTGLAIASQLAESQGRDLTAIYVEPDVGSDARDVGERILERILSRTLGKDADRTKRLVVIDERPHRGILRVLEEEEYDLVVLGSSKLGALGGRLRTSVPRNLIKSTDQPTIVVARAPIPLRNRVLRSVEELLQRLVPQVEREQRVSLVERVQSNSQWDFDFIALMCLSTLIAALGLVQDSASVIIGAMLVAPLMTPLLGIGLALVQGNRSMALMALRSVLLGFITSFVMSAAVGFSRPTFDHATAEMIARDWPDTFDLLVAFVSGLAAAYASSRPGLIAALPGVAIAAALVPPIATAGLAASVDDWELAAGATLLFVANMIAIVLASAISLWVVGLRYVKLGTRWTQVVSGALALAAVVLALGLSFANPPVKGPGMRAPLGVIREAEALLGDGFRLRGMSVDHRARPILLVVQVGGRELPPESLVQRLQELADRSFRRPARVRVEATIELEGR